MAHPYAGHRQNAVEHSRVGKITRRYASGGAIKGSSDDDSKVRKMSASQEREVDPEGGVAKRRADRPMRAKGGAVKGKHNAKTIVNVITSGHPAGGALPPGPPMAPPGPPMGIAPAAAMPPPRPPMAPPMGPGGPPPMPMRAKGGRIHRADGGSTSPKRYNEDEARKTREILEQRGLVTPSRAKGGRVNQGTKVFEQSKRSGTQVTHDDGKADLDDLNRKRVVTFQTGGGVKSFMAGGRVESPDGVASASKLPGGGGGGEARLAKAHRAGRKG